MSLLPTPIVDYTDKDFDSLRERLYALIRSVFPQWTDENVLAFGNILVELFSHVGDMLTFYQDNQAGESRMVTATQRASVIKLAKMIGYELPGATAATATVRIYLPNGVTPGSVDFPAGTVCRTREVTDPVRFQVLSPVTIPPAADPPEIYANIEHSESRQDIVGSSDLPDQRFILSSTPFLDGSLDGNVTTTQGTWTEVDSFLDSGPTDRHFAVEVDQNDRATVIFGDGTNGIIPTGDITMDYKVGGGDDGNVEQGEIVIVEGSFQDSFANPVQVACENAAKAAGGGPRETVEAAQVNAPQSLRVLNRTVAREDYEINALRVPGVARALMLTSDQRSTIDENAGFLHIIPTGGGQPSEALKDDVLEMVTQTYPNTITFHTTIDGTDFLPVNLQATVYLRQGQNASTVRQALLDNLDAFFAITNPDGTPNENVDYGYNFKDSDGNPAGEVAFSDVYNVVRDTDGVRKVGDQYDDFLLNGSDDDVPLEIWEFPVIGTVTLKNGDTGLPL